MGNHELYCTCEAMLTSEMAGFSLTLVKLETDFCFVCNALDKILLQGFDSRKQAVFFILILCGKPILCRKVRNNRIHMP